MKIFHRTKIWFQALIQKISLNLRMWHARKKFWSEVFRKEIKEISELPSNIFYMVAGVNKFTKIVYLRRVIDDKGYFDPPSFNPETIGYRYADAIIEGYFIVPGLLKKIHTIDGKIHLIPDDYPSINFGGILISM